MKVAYFDLIGGAAGNMILGALLDAGADLNVIEASLRGIQVSSVVSTRGENHPARHCGNAFERACLR